MPPRRKRYLDNTAPADNTANVVRPVNRMIQVKQKDTPARREKETREYQARVERGQRIINTFARTPAGRRAANKAYAIESQKAKQEASKEEAAAVVGSLFKPLMPSTYVDMAAAIKNGQVNNVTDALAAPYLTGNWSERNPGKALALNVAIPTGVSLISKVLKGTGIPIGGGAKWHLKLPINENYYYRQGKGLIDDANASGIIRVRSSAAPESSSNNRFVRLLRKDFDVPFFLKGRPWFNDKLETIINMGGGNYQWMPITKSGAFRPNAKFTDKGVMGRATPLVDGEPGLANASDFIGFTPKRFGYISRGLKGK